MTSFKKVLKVISLSASAIYIGLIFIFAAISTNIPKAISENDKLTHMIEFGVLMILLLITFEIWEAKDKLLLALIGLLFFTITSEVLQIFILNRTFSAYDMVADLIGGFIGFLLFSGVKIIWVKKQNKKHKKQTLFKLAKS